MKIEPKLPTGFRDYLPDEAAVRERILETVKREFRLAGFSPLETPGLEREAVLTGGDPDFKKQIFRAGIPGMKEELALRFDLTVPLARVAASYPNALPRPFKRYQIGEVWRGERPQAGRFREFLQCDADIVGSSSILADADIVNLIYRVMTALGFRNFLIRVNNRKVLNGLPAFAGFPEKNLSQVLRAIDKLDKQDWSEVKKELALKDGGALSTAAIAAVKRFLDIEKGSRAETLTEAQKLLAGSKEVAQGLSELAELGRALAALGVPDKNWTIDFSVARGLGYYTGPVFETVLPEAPQFGSVMSGGRYDGLVGRFGNANVPATGVSVGLDRLFAAMKGLGMVKDGADAGIIVLNFDPATTEACLGVLSDIRDVGLTAEIYLGAEKTLRGQLSYAVKKNYAGVVILGGAEMQKGVAQVKVLKTHDQMTVPLTEVAAYFQSSTPRKTVDNSH